MSDPLPGDDLVPDSPLIWDREVTLAATPAEVWPWLVQLGKARGGWYLPARLDPLIPGSRRALWRIDPAFQTVAVGDRVPDYGPDGWFEARIVEPEHALVWWTRRQRDLEFSWALVTEPVPAGTRLRIRLRMNRRLGARARPLVELGGGLTDRMFLLLLFAGLRERVSRR